MPRRGRGTRNGRPPARQTKGRRPTRAPVPAEARTTRIRLRAPAYVTKWHRVNRWAEAVLPGDVSPFPSRSPRIAGFTGLLVRDLYDEEEAYERHNGLENADDLEPGPGRDQGGTRRVAVRCFTWVEDTTNGVAYAPQWITTGWGMSAKAAITAHRRYIDGYATALGKGIESRRLLVTAIEIVFWTAGQSTNYV